MKKLSRTSLFAVAFRALTNREFANLLYHLKAETSILCDSWVWTDGRGGA